VAVKVGVGSGTAVAVAVGVGGGEVELAGVLTGGGVQFVRHSRVAPTNVSRNRAFLMYILTPSNCTLPQIFTRVLTPSLVVVCQQVLDAFSFYPLCLGAVAGKNHTPCAFNIASQRVTQALILIGRGSKVKSKINCRLSICRGYVVMGAGVLGKVQEPCFLP
jgi:hypothetical protein